MATKIKFKISPDVIALIFSAHTWGVEKKADKNSITTDADKSRLKLTKSIIDCQEYDAIQKHLAKTREFVMDYSVPSFFQRGSYLFKVGSVDLIETGLRIRTTQLSRLVDALIAVLPEKKEEAKAALGTQYNEADYPAPEAIRSAIGYTHQWIEFSVPQMLPAKVREEAVRKFQNMWDTTAADVCALLRTGLAGMVDRAVDRLTPGEDGQRKRLHETVLSSLIHFCETFDAKNVVNDEELNRMVGRVRGILEQVEGIGMLRDDEATRDHIAAQFKTIQEAMRPLVDGVRRIDL